MRYLLPVISLIAAISIASAQTQTPDGPLATFEVASVKSNKNGPGSPMMGRSLPGRFEATNMPAKILLLQAYGVPTYRIQGAPPWLDSERFDIAAKAPDGTQPDLRLGAGSQRRQARTEAHENHRRLRGDHGGTPRSRPRAPGPVPFTPRDPTSGPCAR